MSFRGLSRAQWLEDVVGTKGFLVVGTCRVLEDEKIPSRGSLSPRTEEGGQVNQYLVTCFRSNMWFFELDQRARQLKLE